VVVVESKFSDRFGYSLRLALAKPNNWYDSRTRVAGVGFTMLGMALVSWIEFNKKKTPDPYVLIGILKYLH
jgi:hypothetical protein